MQPGTSARSTPTPTPPPAKVAQRERRHDSEPTKQTPKRHTPQVKTVVASGVAEVLLDRPKALNALTTTMVQALRRLYARWDDAAAAAARGAAGGESAVGAVVLRAAPSIRDRAFCAGGDVKDVVRAAREGRVREAQAFFEHEYACDWAIGGPLARDLSRARPSAAAAGAGPRPPPVAVPLRVALVDSVVMGGGVGLSLHGHAVVATERTVWAMPEVAIGIQPDVGVVARLMATTGGKGGKGGGGGGKGGHAAGGDASSSSSSPLHGGLLTPRVGLWLALSGARVGGGALRALGLATHCAPAASLDAAVAALRRRQRELADEQRQQQRGRRGGGGNAHPPPLGLAGDPAALSAVLAEFEFASEAEADAAAERAARQKAVPAAAPPAMTARELRARLPLIEAAFGAGDARQQQGDPGGAVAAIVAALRAAAEGRSHADIGGARGGGAPASQLLPPALQPAAMACPEARRFAAETAAAIASGSAFAAAVTLEHARRSRGLGLREALVADYSLAARFCSGERGDMWEGVRARLVDRGRPGTAPPRWAYARPEDVPAAEVRAMFEPPHPDAARALRAAGIVASGEEEDDRAAGGRARL